MGDFQLTEDVIEAESVKQRLLQDTCGALVSFEGVVRNHNNRRPVAKLIYTAYVAMAIKQGNSIIEDALSRFDIEDASCVHRVGELAIGELAIFVGVVSAHRQAGFDACRYILDTVKQEVPIFKEEFYTDSQQSLWLSNNG